MAEKLVIPPDVVDRKAYLQYLAIGKNPILKNPFYETSEGDVINLKVFPATIRKQIAHLSPSEQETVMELKNKYNRLIAQRGGVKTKAFQANNGDKVDRQRKNALEQDCIELLGKMFTPAETVQILGEEYGIVVTERHVSNILTKYLPEIERRREEFRNKVQDVRLYNKRSRLEELGWMYSKMKQRYISLQSDTAYNSMLRTLEQIRKEAEGDTLTINGAIDISVETEVQLHIQQEIYKTINLKEIILGRVAARMGFDLGKLVAGLHNSYYSKFIQMSGDFDPNASMMFPSANQYDFEEIEKHVNVNEVQDIKAIDVTEAEHNVVETGKDIFLRKIREQRARQQQRMESVDSLADSKRPDADTPPGMDRPRERFADKFIKGGSAAARAKGGDGKRIKK